MDEEEFQELTSKYGKVLDHHLGKDPDGKFKTGWVEYGNRSSAENAVNELNNRRMDDWNMRLQVFIPKGATLS